ncbi:hypothetical protein BST_3112 [Bacillus stercoris]
MNKKIAIVTGTIESPKNFNLVLVNGLLNPLIFDFLE